jgi:hypothetical protein
VAFFFTPPNSDREEKAIRESLLEENDRCCCCHCRLQEGGETSLDVVETKAWTVVIVVVAS